MLFEAVKSPEPNSLRGPRGLYCHGHRSHHRCLPVKFGGAVGIWNTKREVNCLRGVGSKVLFMCSIVTDRSCVHEQGHLGGLVNVTAVRYGGAYQTVMITSSLEN